MTPKQKTNPTNVSPVADNINKDTNKQIFSKILSVFPEDNIFIPLEEGKKHSYQPNWQKKRNLIYPDTVNKHIEEGGNTGLILGKWFNNTTWVLFDCEQEGILPEDVKAIIDSYTVLSFNSPHGGLNRIVEIEDKEAYNLLDSYKETITNIREGDDEDLELITNGGSPIPPTNYDHTNCTENKSCSGKDRYTTVSINPDAHSMGLGDVEELGSLLGLEGNTDEEQYHTKNINEDVPNPSPTFNFREEFNKNVPSVKHSFQDRLEYMKYGDWEGQDLFIKLWHGNFEEISGSDKQGKAEMKLANYIGFFFGKNERIVRMLMDTVPFDTYYERYDSHRKHLLEYATSVDWCYCEGVSFKTKYAIATQIWIDDEIKVSQLTKKVNRGKDTIYNTINILLAEDVIEKKKNGIYKNKRITEGYLTRLYNIDKKYNPEDSTEDDTISSNIERCNI